MTSIGVPFRDAASRHYPSPTTFTKVAEAVPATYSVARNQKVRPMMKLSARNQIKGRITKVEKGQTTGHVHIDIGNGATLHPSITNEAIDDLVLKVGDEATAVIKSSNVMVAK